MKNLLVIKIPTNLVVIYSDKKNIITLLGPIKKISLKLKLKVIINFNGIKVTTTSLTKFSNSNNKKLKSLQGTTVALLNQAIVETSSIIHKKLKLVGVGYRAFEIEEMKNKLFMFKLGFSHSVFFRTPNNLQIVCLKFTKLFIYGSSYQNVTHIAALIRSYKKPEPYKGKGILYETEKIRLKEGKKV